ncbi:methyltransferase domain-containing protein [Clostridium sp. YIM B02500]|uniref:class I SAM-dependent methyltransferase n=1 Tax=Clostridium sp. YIM B02500 TaxID=2910681 RepID=UPI001EEE173F|nr:methyltransferase domain-containing protein [Clostridium sp. YIM B02500]
MANNDKIYEAYMGNFGNETKNNVMERVNWILDEVNNARSILDVGCSQGIVSLLMAERGKRVLGLDIQKEAVEFADSLLKEKYNDIKENVEFRCIDFLDFDENVKFDTVVMTEVLEHLEDPSKFIVNAKKYLHDNGLLVVTVPFGVNNHPDHYSTFYLSNIIDVIEKEFQIEKIEYMGRWLGLVAKKCERIIKFNYTHENVALLESNFLRIDWAMTRKLEKLYSDKIKANEKYRESTQTYSKLREKHNNTIKEFNTIKERHNNTIKELNSLKADNKGLLDEKNQLMNIVEKLVNDFNDEISILKENKALINRLETQKNYLKHENDEYRRKLSLITNTFVGKIGIKVYKLLKKLKAKLK